jgi:membrane-bound serine protease (ClpP class)
VTILLTNTHPLFASTPALLALTLGLALIYLELNRPGSILPGAFGLTISLLALPSLFFQGIHAPALTLLVAAIIIATGLRRRIHPLISAVATLMLILALKAIPGVSHLAATFCGLFLGAGTSVLIAIAHRARTNKGLDLP